MSTEVLVAIITSVCALVGTIITVAWGNKLTLYRIDQLEKKVSAHNNLIERTYSIEKRLDVDEEKIKVANHRITDLERKEK